MIVVAQKGESHPAAAVSSKLFSGMLDGRRTEYRHDNQPTDHVCIDPRGGVRACVRAGHRKRIESESEREREKGRASARERERASEQNKEKSSKNKRREEEEKKKKEEEERNSKVKKRVHTLIYTQTRKTAHEHTLEDIKYQRGNKEPRKGRSRRRRRVREFGPLRCHARG